MNSEAPTRPAPLTTPDIDLKGFPGFVLDVERLLASELVALGTPEEISAALMLWCRAWQQSPPGSLPNNDRVLASFSKAKNWKRVREMAMRGFILCSDGRYYHKFVCQQVLDAWSKRQIYREKRDKEAKRLQDWRDKKQVGNASGNALGNEDETRFKASTKHVRREGEGEYEGEGKLTTSDPSGSGEKSPPGLTAHDALFQIAVPWLVANGAKDTNARSLLGGAEKQLGPEAAWELASECMRVKPIEPTSWLAAGLNARLKLRSGKPKQGQSLAEKQVASAAEAEQILFGNKGEIIDAAE